MPYLHTMQSCYEPLRDFTAVDTAFLDGTSAGRTYDFTDMPSHAKHLTPNHNAVEIIFPCGIKYLQSTAYIDASDGLAFQGRLWGYSESGPAEHIADISVTVGLARIGDSSHALWGDTIVVSSDTHVATCSVSDSDKNRIAKLTLDTIGYSYLMFDTTLDPSQNVNVWYRPY